MDLMEGENRGKTKTSDVKITKTETIYKSTMSQEDVETVLRNYTGRSSEAEVIFLTRIINEDMDNCEFTVPDGVIVQDTKTKEFQE